MDTLLYSNVLVVIGIGYLFGFFYSLTRRNNALVNIFAGLCLVSAVYVFGTSIQVSAQDISRATLGYKMKYFGVPFITAAWIAFAHRIKFKRNMTFLELVISLAIPALTVFLVTTNEHHHLYYAEVSMADYGGAVLSRRIPGPFYYLNVAHTYFGVIFGIYVFGQAWRQSKWGLRNPYFWLFVGRVFHGIVAAIYLAGLTPMGLDIFPIVYLLVAIPCSVALFRYNLFDTQYVYSQEVFSRIKEGLICIDDQGLLVDFNNAAQRVFPWLRQENKGKPITAFPRGQEMVNHNESDFSMTFAMEDGVRHYEIRVTSLMERNRNVGRIYILVDETERKRLIDELNYLAEYDSLTGVYNRRKILEVINGLMEQASLYEPLSLLILDMDNFKSINDSYGHLAGDQVLKNVIAACEKVIDSKGLIGRYGGEEFVVVLPKTDAPAAAVLAEQILAVIARTVTVVDGEALSVTASLGLASSAMLQTDSKTPEKLLGLADAALYQAKGNGKNCLCIHAS